MPLSDSWELGTFKNPFTHKKQSLKAKLFFEFCSKGPVFLDATLRDFFGRQRGCPRTSDTGQWAHFPLEYIYIYMHVYLYKQKYIIYIYMYIYTCIYYRLLQYILQYIVQYILQYILQYSIYYSQIQSNAWSVHNFSTDVKINAANTWHPEAVLLKLAMKANTGSTIKPRRNDNRHISAFRPLLFIDSTNSHLRYGKFTAQSNKSNNGCWCGI